MTLRSSRFLKRFKIFGGLEIIENALLCMQSPDNIEEISETVTLNGGQYASLACTVGGIYDIRPDIDIWVRSSTNPALQALTLTQNTTGIRNTTSSFASFTALDFGTNSITLEAWASVETDTTNDPRVLFIGNSAASFIDWQVLVNASGQMQQRIDIDGAAASVTGTILTQPLDTSLEIGTTIRHIAVVVDRSGTPTVHFYWDGALVGSTTFTDGGGLMDFSALANGNYCVGCTQGSAANWGGKRLGHRIYQGALSAAQIAALNNVGITQLSNQVPNPAVWLNFSEADSWADPDEPEIKDAAGATLLTLDNPIGGLDVSDNTAAVTGGAMPLTTNSRKILAGECRPVICTNGFLNFYSAPSASGTALVSPK